MRLDGRYTGPDVNVPDYIHATGKSDEFMRVGPLPRVEHPDVAIPWPDNLAQPGLDVGATLPASREVVRQIARHVEIDCTDQRLIDWMGDA